jgi:hypothetical protein
MTEEGRRGLPACLAALRATREVYVVDHDDGTALEAVMTGGSPVHRPPGGVCSPAPMRAPGWRSGRSSWP